MLSRPASFIRRKCVHCILCFCHTCLASPNFSSSRTAYRSTANRLSTAAPFIIPRIHNSNPFPKTQLSTFCNLQLQFKLHLQHAHPRTCLASVGHSVRFGRGYSHRLCACQSSSDMLRVVRVLSSLMYVYRGAKPNKHSKHTIERDDKNVWMGA